MILVKGKNVLKTLDKLSDITDVAIVEHNCYSDNITYSIEIRTNYDGIKHNLDNIDEIVTELKNLLTLVQSEDTVICL